jgi:hypothetical protein
MGNPSFCVRSKALRAAYEDSFGKSADLLQMKR